MLTALFSYVVVAAKEMMEQDTTRPGSRHRAMGNDDPRRPRSRRDRRSGRRRK